MTKKNQPPSFSVINLINRRSPSGSKRMKRTISEKETNEKELTPAEMRAQNVARKSRNRLIGLILLFSFGIAVTLYFLSSYSDVGKLSVAGTEEVIVQEVIDSSAVQSGDSLWGTLFNKEEVEQRIETTIPQVKSVTLSLESWNDLVFQVDEYQTVAYLTDTNGYYQILENGKVLDNQQEITRGGLPILSDFEEGDTLRRFLEEYSELEEPLHKSISEIQYDPDAVDQYRIRLYMNDGNQVVASIPTFSQRMQYYPAMKEETGANKGIFNLQAGAYFTPYSSENEQEEGESENE